MPVLLAAGTSRARVACAQHPTGRGQRLVLQPHSLGEPAPVMVRGRQVGGGPERVPMFHTANPPIVSSTATSRSWATRQGVFVVARGCGVAISKG